MALNASGPISLAGAISGQSIALELSLSATGEISLNDSSVRTLAGVPSGAITMPTNFWGKSTSNTVVISNTNSAATNNINNYQFSASAGYGTRYSVPAELNVTSANQSLNSTSEWIVISTPSTNKIYLYNWSYASGFGTAINSVADTTSAGKPIRVSPTNNFFVGATTGAPYILAYAVSSSGIGTKYASASTGYNSTANGNPQFAITNTGSYVLKATGTSYLQQYAFNPSTGWGSLSNVASVAVTQSHSCNLNPTSQYLAVAVQGAPYIGMYNYSTTTGIGSAISCPSIATGSSMNRYACAFNTDNLSVAWAGVYSSGFNVACFPFSNGSFGSALSVPSGTIGQCRSVDFNKEGNAMIVAGGADLITAYQYSSSSGVGTKYSAPSPSPGALTYNAAFSKT